MMTVCNEAGKSVDEEIHVKGFIWSRHIHPTLNIYIYIYIFTVEEANRILIIITSEIIW